MGKNRIPVGGLGRRRIDWWGALSLLLVGLLPTVAAAQVRLPGAPQPTAAAPLVLHDVTVIDVRDGRRLPQHTAVIAGNRIQALGPTQSVRVPAGARVVEARGQYLIPGLRDMHTHTRGFPDVAYPMWLVHGITGVRDAGSNVPLATLNQWKQEIVAGARAGPRLLVSGPSLFTADSLRQSRTSVTTDEHQLFVPPGLEAQVVDSLKAAGADLLKFYHVAPAMRLAMAAEARRLGIPFGGHTGGWRGPNPVGGLEFSDSGATFLDHQPYLDRRSCFSFDQRWSAAEMVAAFDICRAAARRFRQNNTWIVGFARAKVGYSAREYLNRIHQRSGSRRDTFRPPSDADVQAWVHEPTTTQGWVDYLARRRAESGDSSVLMASRMLIESGMPYVLGTDEELGGFGHAVGIKLHQALLGLVIAGMTPLEALQTATLNPALALRMTDSLGTVEQGKVADLVLLDGDPLADIMHTIDIRAVVANGRYYDRAALDRLRITAELAAALR